MATKKKTEDETANGDAQETKDEAAPGAAATTARGGPVALRMDDQPGPEPEPEPVPEGPVYGRVPYPHHALILPEGGPIPEGEDSRSDLIIGREWTEIPGDQVDRAKRISQKAGIPLELMIPDSGESGEE